jgi:hypothetical protein
MTPVVIASATLVLVSGLAVNVSISTSSFGYQSRAFIVSFDRRG